MTPQNLSIAVLLGMKVAALVGLALYAIFAAIMVRQEQLMAGVLEEAFEPILRILTIIHLLAAVGVFVVGIILL